LRFAEKYLFESFPTATYLGENLLLYLVLALFQNRNCTRAFYSLGESEVINLEVDVRLEQPRYPVRG